MAAPNGNNNTHIHRPDLSCAESGALLRLGAADDDDDWILFFVRAKSCYLLRARMQIRSPRRSDRSRAAVAHAAPLLHSFTVVRAQSSSFGPIDQLRASACVAKSATRAKLVCVFTLLRGMIIIATALMSAAPIMMAGDDYGSNNEQQCGH